MVGAGKAKVREIKYKDVTKAKKKSPSKRRAKREGGKPRETEQAGLG